MDELAQYIILPQVDTSISAGECLIYPQECEKAVKWTTDGTKMLIDLYGKYRKKVGTFQIRSIKQMWQKIATELSAILDMNISYNHCENRWHVLDHNYKKYTDNQNSTGRGKKFFEYAEEMNNIFGKKKTVHPEIRLTSETVSTLDDLKQNESPEETKIISASSLQCEKKIPEAQSSGKPSRKRKVTTVELMRQDRINYQKKRLQMEEKKLEELKVRNALIKERNKILEGKVCHCLCEQTK